MNIKYKDLKYFILMLLTNFGSFEYYRALRERVLGLEDWINIHVFLLKLWLSKLNQPYEGQTKVHFVSLLKYVSKKGRKIEENLLTEQIYYLGAIR